MTLSDIQLLRLYLSDPSREDEVFTSTKLQDILDRNSGDVNGAAADGWRVKAATVHDWYLSQTDGSLLSRQQVFDHCMSMVEHFSKRSSSDMVSVALDTLGGGSSATQSLEF